MGRYCTVAPVSCSCSQMLTCLRCAPSQLPTLPSLQLSCLVIVQNNLKMAGRLPHQLLPKTCILLCLVLLSSRAQTTRGSACNIYALYSCIAYAKSTQVPSRACCNALEALGGGVLGSKCLCSLMTSQIANQYGVVPQYAIGMPYRCGIPVPWHETCNGE